MIAANALSAEKQKTKLTKGIIVRAHSAAVAWSVKFIIRPSQNVMRMVRKCGKRQSKRITQAQAVAALVRYMASAKRMCIIGLKKTAQILKPNYHILEVDELYWFIGQKGTSETRENCYVIPIVSRLPRQIVGIDAAFDKSPERIQALVDAAPPAENYCTDGFWGYVDVVYPGKHIRNISNKNDTFTIEGVNAPLRHYIPILRRRSRCFPRKLETLKAVLEVFADAYNAFGVAKMKFRQCRDSISRELPFSVLDFL